MSRLYCYVDPRHEQTARRIVEEECPGAFVTCSHEVAPEFREYERLSTVVVNAYLGPVLAGYLERLGPRLREVGITAPPHITQSTLNPEHLLAGRMKIDRARAEAAIHRLGARLGLDVMTTAQGIVSIVTANMARAIRVISVQRGHDPREYVLVAFGGAGPLHAARLARELEIPRILVPRHPGVLCALGLLLSDLRTDYARTRLLPVDDGALPAMAETFAELTRRATEWFDREGIAPDARRIRRTVDMRYAGQNYELPVAWTGGPLGPALLAELIEGFERAHAQMYGYIAAEEPVQAVTFRLEATAAARRPETRAHPPSATALASAPASAPAMIGSRDVWLPEAGKLVAVAVYDRERLEPGHRLSGPAIVEQMDATTLLLPGQTAAVDPYLNLDVAA